MEGLLIPLESMMVKLATWQESLLVNGKTQYQLKKQKDIKKIRMNSVRILNFYEIPKCMNISLCFLERPIKVEPMDEYEPPIPRIDKFDRPIKLEPVESRSSQIKTEVKNPSDSKSKSSKSSSSSPHKSHHKHHSSSSSSSKEIKESNGTSERRKESKHHSNEKRDKNASSGQHEKSHTSSKRKHNDSPIDSKEATSDDDRGATASKYQKIDSQSSKSSKSSHKDKERHRHSDSSKHSEKPKSEKEKESSSSSSKKHHSSKESSSSSPTKKEHHKKSSKSKKPVVEEEDEQIDNSEGMGFAEALAMFDMPSTSRKKDSSSSLADKPIRLLVPAKKPHSDSREASTSMVKKTLKVLQSQPSMLQERSRLDPLPDITPLLIPDYKPMPLNSVVKDYLYSSLAGNGRPQRPEKTDKELEFESFSSKANRTKVFSGNKQQQRSDIPSLYEMCIRILQENIDFLETTGGVPFDILRPVLERAKPEQLSNIEYYNPYLLEECDVLWEPHCKRKFRTKKREENEAWREMYDVSQSVGNLLKWLFNYYHYFSVVWLKTKRSLQILQRILKNTKRPQFQFRKLNWLMLIKW